MTVTGPEPAAIAQVQEAMQAQREHEAMKPAPIEAQQPIEIALPKIEPTTAPPPPPKRRARLYDPHRRGYRRATTEEGIEAELATMHDEARGTPFFGGETKRAPAPTVDARVKLGIVERRKP